MKIMFGTTMVRSEYFIQIASMMKVTITVAKLVRLFDTNYTAYSINHGRNRSWSITIDFYFWIQIIIDKQIKSFLG